jgi:membrane protease subunit (stomatin/prohibitin family)
MGLSLDSFMIQSISLPDELQVALDKRIAMGMAGDLNAYTKFQTANAIPIAAANEGGLAGVGASLGAGLGMAQMMTQAMNPNAQPAVASPAPAATESPEDRLGKLKGLLDKGLISVADFDNAKAEILKKLIG